MRCRSYDCVPVSPDIRYTLGINRRKDRPKQASSIPPVPMDSKMHVYDTGDENNGHRSCTIVNLGKIAVRLGRKLYFDPEKQKFIGDDEANRYIHQPMRAPWRV